MYMLSILDSFFYSAFNVCPPRWLLQHFRPFRFPIFSSLLTKQGATLRPTSPGWYPQRPRACGLGEWVGGSFWQMGGMSRCGALHPTCAGPPLASYKCPVFINNIHCGLPYHMHCLPPSLNKHVLIRFVMLLVVLKVLAKKKEKRYEHIPR